MKFGYARVSTKEQNPDHQTDALERAGCDKIFVDKASGVLERRPEMDKLMDHLRAGDVLVVTKLDRLGRSVRNLTTLGAELERMNVNLVVLDQGIDTTTAIGRVFFHFLAAMAQLEHDLIVERTKAGLEAARARGRKGGRRAKMSEVQAKEARRMYESREYTVGQIAEAFGVGRATIYRTLDLGEPSPIVKEQR